MPDSNGVHQLAGLRATIFAAVREWNARHPHRLRSHLETASIHVTSTFTDDDESPKYAIVVECALAGRPSLTFHGRDLGKVAEQARLAIEHRLEVEIALREENAREVAAIVARYGEVDR